MKEFVELEYHTQYDRIIAEASLGENSSGPAFHKITVKPDQILKFLPYLDSMTEVYLYGSNKPYYCNISYDDLKKVLP